MTVMTIRLYINVVLVITTTVILRFGDAVTNYGACRTPNRMEATCINLEDCRYLFELVQDPNLSQNDRAYLRSSQCGYRDRKVLICCPSQYMTLSATTRAPLAAPAPAPAFAQPGVLFPESMPAKRPVSNSASGFSGGNGRINSSSSLLPKFPQCGNVLDNRIYGGTETAIDEFPWTALIEYLKSNGVKGHYCGGALISERYVLTAAHCVKPSDLPAGWRLTGVRLGEWDTRSDPDCSKEGCAPSHKDIATVQSIPHPDYASHNDPNDIALLRLAESVQFSDFVKPICLPTTTSLRMDTFLNTAMDVAGWGSTETSSSSFVKLKATLKVKDLDACRAKYAQLNGIKLDSTQLCAGGESGIDTCRGDSGGPLMFQDDVNGKAAYYLVGIVSYGPTPCGLSGWPAIYTRVGAFIDWIEKNMQT